MGKGKKMYQGEWGGFKGEILVLSGENGGE
jgi:hypothetical protein